MQARIEEATRAKLASGGLVNESAAYDEEPVDEADLPPADE